MVSGVPLDNEAPMVTSGLLDLSGAQSFEGAHGARICAMFIEVSVRLCCTM